jgi:hypothetical protein
MSLVSLVDNSRTDKNTDHSYLPLYDELLRSRKTMAKNVLEVGIYDGGSIKLWSDYFVNATVYGVDVMSITNVWAGIKEKSNIVLHTSTDAYNPSFVSQFQNTLFDMCLDDGPHTLESMKQFILLYSPLLNEDGILIIEDVQSEDWIHILEETVPNHLKQFVRYYDLRPNKNRYDDIVFTIDRSS